MNQADELGRLLADLGSNADEVATALRERGVQGVRNTARFLNPIVRLSQSFLCDESITFDVMRPGVLRLTYLNGTTSELPLPAPVQQFLCNFGRGAYPDIELDVT